MNNVKKSLSKTIKPDYLTQIVEYQRFGLKAKIRWFFFFLFTKDEDYIP